MQATITGKIHLHNPVPAAFLHRAQSENTFANPAYTSAKVAGRYTGGIPRTVASWWQDGNGYHFPRGYGKRLHVLAKGMAIPITWVSDRVEAPVVYPNELFGICLRTYQKSALDAASHATQGVIVSPTGSGKTLTALELIRLCGQRALIIVHSNALAIQWRKVIKDRLGIVAGKIGDGVWVEGDHITVATVQTLNKRMDKTAQLATRIGTVICDECHHLPAVSFAAVIGMFPAMYRYGFTATPKRKDGLEEMVYRLLGDVLAIVSDQDVLDTGGIVPVRIEVMDTGCKFPEIKPEDRDWSAFLTAVETHIGRNRSIVSMATRQSKTRQVLILTDRVAHAQTLAELLPSATLVHGALKPAEKKQALVAMHTADIVIGTKGMLGEGLDCSTWSCVILASPISGETPLQQVVGRVIRGSPGKKDGLVIDLVDPHPFGWGSFKKRRVVYNRRDWPISQAR